MAESALEAVERALGYGFLDRDKLALALTHSSWARERERSEHNERLEFLGDAVLGLLAAEALLARFPAESEGFLTKARARLVNRQRLAEVGGTAGLGAALLLGRSEERAGRSKSSILADAVEAALAAVYLDGGLSAARQVAARLLLAPEQLDEAARNFDEANAKSALQELLQAHALPLPQYRLVRRRGPEHRAVFEVELALAGGFAVRGEGSPKQAAEQSAAAAALARRAEWLPESADDPAS